RSVLPPVSGIAGVFSPLSVQRAHVCVRVTGGSRTRLGGRVKERKQTMDEVVLVVDADRNYYAFDAERFAATEAGEDGSEVHAFSAEEVDAAKVGDQDREAIEAAIQPDEVSGFGTAIPGVEVKLVKKPG